jgi:hypothetical protein
MIMKRQMIVLGFFADFCNRYYVKCIPGSQDYSLYFTVLLQKLPKNPSNSGDIDGNKLQKGNTLSHKI